MGRGQPSLKGLWGSGLRAEAGLDTFELQIEISPPFHYNLSVKYSQAFAVTDYEHRFFGRRAGLRYHPDLELRKGAGPLGTVLSNTRGRLLISGYLATFYILDQRRRYCLRLIAVEN